MPFEGLTAELVNAAIDLVNPTIEHAMATGLAKHPFGNAVVLKPSIIFEPKYKTWMDAHDGSTEHPFSEVILVERQWHPEHWGDAPYMYVSRAKAFASWKHKMSTRRLQIEAPWAYEPTWTKWPGSIWLPGNLTVSFSGVQDYFDEFFSKLVADAIWALSMDGLFNKESERELGIMRNDGITYIG